MSAQLKIIFAVSSNFYFSGPNNTLPWPSVPEDMAHFKKRTTGKGNNVVIMGYNTFLSLNSKPLNNRYNIIISSRFNAFVATETPTDQLELVGNLDEAISSAKARNPDEIWIIGGQRLIETALKRPDISEVCISIIAGEIEKKIPVTSKKFYYNIPKYLFQDGVKHETVAITNEYQVDVLTYFSASKDIGKLSSTPSPVFNPPTGQSAPPSFKNEIQYTSLLKKILESGEERGDRTKVGTISMFGNFLEFDVSENFPLLTTKRVYWKGVVAELLWFISGSSDSKELEAQGVNIWRGNTSREFLDNLGFSAYREGELGTGYGWHWRNFGAEYVPLNQRGNDFKFTGVDQLQEAINLIKTDPTSRRIMVSAWNSAQLDKVCLPACHYGYIFYVSGEKLSILVTMRSCDVFLGLPFNIASYSLLLYMVAHITGKTPHQVKFSLGDTHIYKNHITAVKEQLTRQIRAPPQLKITRSVANIDDFRAEDFELIDYNPNSTIKAEMAI